MTLWRHQEETVAFMDKNPLVYNMSDAGTGKTRACLEWIYRTGNRTLIVCPKTLMRPAWVDDAAKFYPDMKVEVADATHRDRILKSKADVVVTNHDAATWMASNPPTGKFNALIIDEATAFSNYSAKRTKAMLAIKPLFERRVLMSATPFNRTVQQLWAQMLLLDGGVRLGKSLTRFRQQFCTWRRIPGVNVVVYEDRPEAASEVLELIADISLRYSIDDCLDIPPNHRTDLEVPLPPKLRKAYTALHRRFILELENGATVTTASAAAKMNALLQICSGSVYASDTEGERLKSFIDPYRADVIADLIEESPPAIVFFNWRHQRDMLASRLAKRGLSYVVLDGSVGQRDRDAAVRDFQAGKHDAMLLQPMTGAHGLTLTRARRVIFSAPPVGRSDLYIQGVARIVRGGQTKRTSTVVVRSPGTVEDAVWRALDNREEIVSSFLNYMKELATNV